MDDAEARDGDEAADPFSVGLAIVLGGVAGGVVMTLDNEAVDEFWAAYGDMLQAAHADPSVEPEALDVAVVLTDVLEENLRTFLGDRANTNHLREV